VNVTSSIPVGTLKVRSCSSPTGPAPSHGDASPPEKTARLDLIERIQEDPCGLAEQLVRAPGVAAALAARAESLEEGRVRIWSEAFGPIVAFPKGSSMDRVEQRFAAPPGEAHAGGDGVRHLDRGQCLTSGEPPVGGAPYGHFPPMSPPCELGARVTRSASGMERSSAQILSGSAGGERKGDIILEPVVVELRHRAGADFTQDKALRRPGWRSSRSRCRSNGRSPRPS
jgi:hypothetical protein